MSLNQQQSDYNFIEQCLKHNHIQLSANQLTNNSLNEGDVIGHLGLWQYGDETGELLELYIYLPNEVETRHKIVENHQKNLKPIVAATPNKNSKDVEKELNDMINFNTPGLSAIITDVSQIDIGLTDYPRTLCYYKFKNIKDDPNLMEQIIGDNTNTIEYEVISKYCTSNT